MTVFECRNCIGLACKQQGVCDQYARMKAEELKEQVMKE
jgi:hypothetical protein